MANVADKRRLVQARDALKVGDTVTGLRLVCAVLRCDVPEIIAPLPRGFSTLTRDIARHAMKTGSQPGIAQPKPQGRIIDLKARRAYRARVKICEVIGCRRPGVAHHIKERGRHGDDVESNLLLLCDFRATSHHIGRKGKPGAWHAYATDAERWMAFRDYLPPAARAKVAAAFGIVDEAAA